MSMTSIRSRALKALFCGAVLVSCARSEGEGVLEKFRPLPVSVEGKTTRPGFYVGVQEQEYKKSIEAVAQNAPAGSAQQALGRYFRAVADNDPEKYAALTDADNAAAAADLLAEDRSEMPDVSKVRVVRSFAVGGATLFALDAGARSDAAAVALLFVNKGGKQVCALKDLDHPIVQILISLARAIDEDPDAFAAADAPAGCPQSLSFGELFGDAGQHPVTIRFTGYALHYPINPRGAVDPAARDLTALPADYAGAVGLYADASAALAKGDVEGYAARLGGDKSRQFLAESVSDNKAREAFLTTNGGPRYVRYIIGSPLLKVLVVAPKDGPYTPSTLDYLEASTPAGGKPAIVNFHQLGELDTLLTWTDFRKALVGEYIDPPAKNP